MDKYDILQECSERMLINSHYTDFIFDILRAGIDNMGGINKVKDNIKMFEEADIFNHIDRKTANKLINTIFIDDLN